MSPSEGAGARHRARERALGLLYEAEMKRVPVGEVVAALPVAPDPFAVALAEAAEAHRPEVDELLARHAHGWPLERMAVLDRAVLRLAAAELLAFPEVPTAVALDEAVELAKAYSTDDSPRFVNGVLAAVAHEVRGGDGGP